jgi:hypothetical protein
MATQEQDFNKETNRQFTRLSIKDSQGITIDLTEVQCAQVLQSLLMLSDLQRRFKLSAGRGDTVSKHFEHLLSPAGEMQDSELNSLLQGQSIYIENCTDVRISVRQLEVEKVVELGLVALGLREHQLLAEATAVSAAGASIEETEPQRADAKRSLHGAQQTAPPEHGRTMISPLRCPWRRRLVNQRRPSARPA